MFLPRQVNSQFTELIQYAENINNLNGGSATALFVIHNDQVVTEYYSGNHSQLKGSRVVQPDSRFHVASVRKSYIGFVIAYLLHKGLINSIDDLVTKYLTEQDNEVLYGITIRHLLTHTHGLGTDNHGALCRRFRAGSGWEYRNEGIRLLCNLIYRVSGETAENTLRRVVFDPLEFSETGWKESRDERLVQVIDEPALPPWDMIEKEGNADDDHKNFFVSARELAFWGYLHVKRGKINGNQLIHPEIFELATAVTSPALENKDFPSNGFLWYVQNRLERLSEIGEEVPFGSFQIVGYTGPLLLVVPKHNLVIARMYNKRFNYGGENYLQYIREFGNKAMKCVLPEISESR